jgi:hypothetical protein
MSDQFTDDQFDTDMRYNRAVFPERFAPAADPVIVCLERLTLAAQGCDVTLERIADALEQQNKGGE